MSASGTGRRIRVLVVDDSAVVRKLLTALLSTDPGIEVVGTAPDPIVARDKLVRLAPDVMTLDLEMPRMDGLTFLEKVMQHFPTRTLVISSLSTAGSAVALRALELGAVDVMAKPAIDVAAGIGKLAATVVERVRTVAAARLVRAAIAQPAASERRAPRQTLGETTHKVLALAASTGGTEALKQVLAKLPANAPGTVIVQHMPAAFTRAFAAALDKICAFEVREAVDGDRLLPGLALLAPGNFHMELIRDGAFYHVRLHQQPLLHGVRPAADYLLRSVAANAGANAIGVVLTGMGKDGADGLLAMRNAGAHTVAQDEASSVVYGMPRAAFEAGAVQSVLPLDQIGSALAARLG
jgi:two-component system chemotaxis response regulator CheB